MQIISLLSIVGVIALFFIFSIYFFWVNSERKKREEEKSTLDAVLNRSNDGIVIASSDGKIERVNTALVRLLDIEIGSLIGQDVLALLINKGIETLSQNDFFEAALNQGQEISVDSQLIAVTGQIRFLNIRLFVIPQESEGSKKVVLIIADKTTARELESLNSNQNENLELKVVERTHELKEINDLARSANRIKTEFIANISHEIRTPLHGVFGMLRLLRQDPLTERQQHRLMLAENSVEELTNILESILDISKIEARKLDIEPNDIHLPTLIHDVIHRLAPKARDKGLEFFVDLSRVTYEHVFADPNRISRIFTNLIENAIKFSQHGFISVKAKTTEREDGALILECNVKDTGIGISEDQKKTLFQLFSRAHGSEPMENLGGLGLGLSIAKQLCILMDGDMSFQSTANEGSEFSFNLKLKKIDAEQPTIEMIDLSGEQVAVFVDSAKLAENLSDLIETAGGSSCLLSELPSDHTSFGGNADHLIVDMDLFLKHRADVEKLVNSDSDLNVRRVILAAYPDQISAKIGRDLPPDFALLNLPATGIAFENAFSEVDILPFWLPHSGQPTEEESRLLWKRFPELKVLVVDDNLINQKVVGCMLEEYGVKIEFADNGEEAIKQLSKASSEKFDLVIMDCLMPVMDGYETTVRIREGVAGEEYKGVVIIAVTAGAMVGDRDKCLRSGMDDYITKPVRPFDLEKKILELVITANPAANHTDENGDSAAISPGEELAATLREKLDWNREDLLNRVLGQESVVKSVIQMYVKLSPEILGNLEAAISNEDYKSIKNVAHDLKGVSQNIGAQKLAYLCLEIEVAALERRFDYIVEVLSLLKTHYQNLIKQLKRSEE